MNQIALDCIKFFEQGMSREDIAENLFISVDMVDAMLSNKKCHICNEHYTEVYHCDECNQDYDETCVEIGEANHCEGCNVLCCHCEFAKANDYFYRDPMYDGDYCWDCVVHMNYQPD